MSTEIRYEEKIENEQYTPYETREELCYSTLNYVLSYSFTVFPYRNEMPVLPTSSQGAPTSIPNYVSNTFF